MTYRTTKTSTAKLIKSIEALIADFKVYTYADVEENQAVIRARKLIESLRVKK